MDIPNDIPLITIIGKLTLVWNIPGLLITIINHGYFK